MVPSAAPQEGAPTQDKRLARANDLLKRLSLRMVELGRKVYAISRSPKQIEDEKVALEKMQSVLTSMVNTLAGFQTQPAIPGDPRFNELDVTREELLKSARAAEPFAFVSKDVIESVVEFCAVPGQPQRAPPPKIEALLNKPSGIPKFALPSPGSRKEASKDESGGGSSASTPSAAAAAAATSNKLQRSGSLGGGATNTAVMRSPSKKLAGKSASVPSDLGSPDKTNTTTAAAAAGVDKAPAPVQRQGSGRVGEEGSTTSKLDALMKVLTPGGGTSSGGSTAEAKPAPQHPVPATAVAVVSLTRPAAAKVAGGGGEAQGDHKQQAAGAAAAAVVKALTQGSKTKVVEMEVPQTVVVGAVTAAPAPPTTTTTTGKLTSTGSSRLPKPLAVAPDEPGDSPASPVASANSLMYPMLLASPQMCEDPEILGAKRKSLGDLPSDMMHTLQDAQDALSTTTPPPPPPAAAAAAPAPAPAAANTTAADKSLLGSEQTRPAAARKAVPAPAAAALPPPPPAAVQVAAQVAEPAPPPSAARSNSLCAAESHTAAAAAASTAHATVSAPAAVNTAAVPPAPAAVAPPPPPTAARTAPATAASQQLHQQQLLRQVSNGTATQPQQRPKAADAHHPINNEDPDAPPSLTFGDDLLAEFIKPHESPFSPVKPTVAVARQGTAPRVPPLAIPGRQSTHSSNAAVEVAAAASNHNASNSNAAGEPRAAVNAAVHTPTKPGGNNAPRGSGAAAGVVRSRDALFGEGTGEATHEAIQQKQAAAAAAAASVGSGCMSPAMDVYPCSPAGLPLHLSHEHVGASGGSRGGHHPGRFAVDLPAGLRAAGNAAARTGLVNVPARYHMPSHLVHQSGSNALPGHETDAPLSLVSMSGYSDDDAAAERAERNEWLRRRKRGVFGAVLRVLGVASSVTTVALATGLAICAGAALNSGLDELDHHKSAAAHPGASTAAGADGGNRRSGGGGKANRSRGGAPQMPFFPKERPVLDKLTAGRG